MHYPVDEIITVSRDYFYADDYEIKLVPLRPFPAADYNFKNFLEGAFDRVNV